MERSTTNRSAAAIRNMRDRARRIVRAWRRTYTVDEIATVLDVSKGTVWRWEHDVGLPYRRTAETIVGDKTTLTDRLRHNRSAS